MTGAEKEALERSRQSERGMAKKTQPDGRRAERQGLRTGMSGTGCIPSGRTRAEDRPVARGWKRRKRRLRRRAGVALSAGRTTGKNGEGIENTVFAMRQGRGNRGHADGVYCLGLRLKSPSGHPSSYLLEGVTKKNPPGTVSLHFSPPFESAASLWRSERRRFCRLKVQT